MSGSRNSGVSSDSSGNGGELQENAGSAQANEASVEGMPVGEGSPDSRPGVTDGDAPTRFSMRDEDSYNSEHIPQSAQEYAAEATIKAHPIFCQMTKGGV